MSELHTGGCHCGNLRYQIDGPVDDVAHCHCTICRRTSGGNRRDVDQRAGRGFQMAGGKSDPL